MIGIGYICAKAMPIVITTNLINPKMRTNPTYNKLNVSCDSYGRINLYWSFRTRKECESKIKQLSKKFPSIFWYAPTEQTIWVDSRIDTGERYYYLRGSAPIEIVKSFFDKKSI